MRGYGREYGYGNQGWYGYGGYGEDYGAYQRSGRGGYGYGPSEYGSAGWDDQTGSIWGYSGVGIERDWRTGEPRGGRGDADRVRAGDIMTRNPASVTPDTPLVEVATRMRDLDVGIIPVRAGEGDDQLIGVITDRDIVVRAVAEGKDMKKAKVRDHMTSDVESVKQHSSVREVFSAMKRQQIRRVPVTDDGGRLVGIIAQADLAVDYAGLDLQRETEVEEVIERISEPGRPARYGPRGRGGFGYDAGYRGDRDMGDRLREGWQNVRRGARHLLNRGYDGGWR